MERYSIVYMMERYSMKNIIFDGCSWNFSRLICLEKVIYLDMTHMIHMNYIQVQFTSVCVMSWDEVECAESSAAGCQTVGVSLPNEKSQHLLIDPVT